MLAGDIATPPHRAYDTSSSAVCGGALVCNSLDDEEWSDNLLATAIRQLRGTQCEGSKSSTNLSLIENWPEDPRTPTVCDRQHKI